MPTTQAPRPVAHPSNRTRRQLAGLAVLGVVLLAPMWLAAVGPLTTFANGQVADAAAVNANFGQLATSVTALEGRGRLVQVAYNNVQGASTSTTSTAWTTVNTISLTPAKAGNLVKFDWAHIVGVVRGASHTRIDYRLVQTAPSTGNVSKKSFVGADGTANSILHVNLAGTAIDTTDSTALHSWALQVRPANGASSEAAQLFPLWYAQGDAGEVHTLIASEIHQ